MGRYNKNQSILQKIFVVDLQIIVIIRIYGMNLPARLWLVYDEHETAFYLWRNQEIPPCMGKEFNYVYFACVRKHTLMRGYIYLHFKYFFSIRIFILFKNHVVKTGFQCGEINRNHIFTN